MGKEHAASNKGETSLLRTMSSLDDAQPYVKRTSLHTHTKSTNINFNNRNHNGNNRRTMVTVAYHNRATDYNDDHNISVDNDTTLTTTDPTVTTVDSTVMTDGFSDVIATSARKDECVIPIDHTILQSIPNVKLSVLPSSRNATYSTRCSTTSDA